MKKVVSLLLALIMAFSLVACGEKKGETDDNTDTVPYKIGIVTGSVSQSEDDRRGAEAFQKEYGEDMVQLAIYPDNFTEETETTIQSIVNLSADPLMKAIIVNQAVPGTTEAFRKIKETRPDIICIAGEAHEDLPEISSAADLVTNNDFVSRGYLIIRTAHELGCDTFVHISFPRHMSYETMSRRVAIMKAACEEFGMKFVLETAPDPTSDVGVSGAQAYILEQVPAWVEKYGQKAAYFCTNDAHTGLLLALLVTQIVAFPSALIFGRLSQKYASKTLIPVCIAAYTGIAVFAFFLKSQWQFWVLAVVVGMFQGGVQALSRSHFAKIIPQEKSGEYFGLFDICGKGASFLGTMIVSVGSQLTGSANVGVGSIAILFVIGFVLFSISTRTEETKQV